MTAHAWALIYSPRPRHLGPHRCGPMATTQIEATPVLEDDDAGAVLSKVYG